jgi:serine/threonine protein kinase
LIECPRCHTSYDKKPAFCGTCGMKMPGETSLVTPVADPLIGLIIDNRYRIVDLIGRGGMGAVYRVEHVKMGKIMAMKILHGELSQQGDLTRRFRREAETVSRLSHFNTVSVFDFGSDKGMMYLVMEYIEGRDLREVLLEDGPLPATRCYRVLIQVCSALTEAHEKGIIHRDLKPENILVGKRDEREDFVKVLDFGLAKLKDMHRTKITEQGSLVGTPYYMAPEHIRGDGVDQRSDIYALGAVMYKLLTGDPPFAAPTAMGIISKHLTQPPPRPSAASPDLSIPERADEICLKAMAKVPEARYASANEMRRALADALEDKSPGSEFSRFTSTERRSRQGSPQAPTEKWSAVRADDSGVEENAVPRRSSFVTVGNRELAIGTRSDFYQYSKTAKRRRWGAAIVLLVSLVVLGGGGAAYLVLRGREIPDWTRESEPNNTPQDADPLAVGVPLTGRISGNSTGDDVDWYRLRGLPTGNWAVTVEVSGVPGLDLALQLFDNRQSAPLLTANQTGQGGGERIGPLVVQTPDVFLMVQEVRAVSAPPGSSSASYQIVYHIYRTGL